MIDWLIGCCHSECGNNRHLYSYLSMFLTWIYQYQLLLISISAFMYLSFRSVQDRSIKTNISLIVKSRKRL